jgi:osmotically-inducible protein OsmY
MMRRLVAAAAFAAAAGFLQGCAPLAVTAAAGGAMMATDRRSPGIYIEDESIEWRAFDKLRAGFEGGHINVTSYNRRVLLTGEAPTEEMKKKAEETLGAVTNVREVVNELKVAGASSLAARGNDALITSNVKALMVNNGNKFSPMHIKVLTEANVVFLMGLVTPAEGEAAADIARRAQGVARVVKVFEYVS